MSTPGLSSTMATTCGALASLATRSPRGSRATPRPGPRSSRKARAGRHIGQTFLPGRSEVEQDRPFVARLRGWRLRPRSLSRRGCRGCRSVASFTNPAGSWRRDEVLVVEQLLPLAYHAQVAIVEDGDLHGQAFIARTAIPGASSGSHRRADAHVSRSGRPPAADAARQFEPIVPRRRADELAGRL